MKYFPLLYVCLVIFISLSFYEACIGIANAADIYEAEDALFVGSTIGTGIAGFTGTGYVDYQNASGDYVEWTVDMDFAGDYILSFRYVNGGAGDRPLEIKVNGQVVNPSLSFPVTGSWFDWAYTGNVSVALNAGSNTVRSTAIGFSGGNVDHLQVDTGANSAPVVNAGMDLGINFPRQYLTLDGSVADDGNGEPNGYLLATWSQTNGPATVEFEDINNPRTPARFPVLGVYELQIDATDGEFNTFDTVTITVGKPICPVGDVDGDCKTTSSDLDLIGLDWLDNTGTSIADLDGDGWVKLKELCLLGQSWLDDWTGSLQVSLSPSEAVDAGAQWRVDGGSWQNSGSVVTDLAEGPHDVEYSIVTGWGIPETQTVQITRQQTTVTSAEYLDISQSIVINEFMAANSYIPFTNSLNIYTRVYGWDVNPDWIELHNRSGQSIDISGMYLTDDDDLLTKWRFPDGILIEPNGYLIVFASGKTAAEYPGNYPYLDEWGALHTNFELSSDGEYLALVQDDGVTVTDAYDPEYPPQRGLVSYGRASGGDIGYLTDATPGDLVSNRWTGAANTGAYTGVVGDTKFSVKRGFFNTPFEVIISCDTSDAEIYFTTDSSEPIDIDGNPTLAAQLYSASNKPQITTTTCLRAAAIKSGWLSSDIDTQTYIFIEDVLDQEAPASYAVSWGGYPADYKMEDNLTDLKRVAGDAGYTEQEAKDVIENALLAIPTLSVVAHPDNLFASTDDGIYLNTGTWVQDEYHSIAWERFCSAEMFDPAAGSQFQINCGLRISGGASRQPEKCPKHSFSLRFRSGYGPGKLDYKLFPDSPVDKFNSLQLRAMYNNSWIHSDSSQRARASMIRDQWARDTLLAMDDSSAGFGTYVHLYINGLYWGVYNMHERHDAAHYGQYYGVDADTIDAIKSTYVADGNLDSWYALHTQVSNDASDGNISLSEYQAICQKMDAVNLCDYMIVNHYGGNGDWDRGNWRAVGGGVNNLPWRFYSWDAERILEGISVNKLGVNNSNCPSGLFNMLRNSNEFNILLADRIHKHFYNGGALTSARAIQLWMNRANELDQAIIAESARWGDYRRDVRGSGDLYTRNDHWIPEQNRLMNSYFTVGSGLNRSETVLQGQYIPGGYYPSVDAPVFYINSSYQHGGYIDTGDLLTITNPGGTGTVYYTLDGSDPRLAGGGVNGTALQFITTPISLVYSTHVKARTWLSGTWSALNEAVYVDNLLSDSLRITELMYHPADPNTEFIELQNIGTSAVNLNLVRFTKGVDYTFGDVNVNPGDYVLLVRNQSVFESYYAGQIPGGLPVVQWDMGYSLDNNEDKVKFKDALDRTIQEFAYKDGWYPLTDGLGFSLTIRDPLGDPNLWDQKEGWRASLYAGGTPGAPAQTVLADGSIVINEVLAHSHATEPDWIELYNTTAQEIDISGWFLSDSDDDDPNIMKYQIPSGTTIQGYSYKVFVENITFGNPMAPGTNTTFGLSEAGETVYLYSGEIGGGITGYYQTEENFDASETDVTFGRYEKAELSGGYDFMRMISATQGSANSDPLIADVVITEIHYNPIQGTDYEFVELYNRSGSPVTLMTLADHYTSPTTTVTENIPWRLEGINYEFPANTTIPAGGRIMVAKDPAIYGGSNSTVLGPYDGKLDNGGEQIELQIPGDWEYGEPSRYWIPIEKIDYDDASPWPTSPDGGGDSLKRINPNLYGRDYSNWSAGTPTPGT